MLLTFAFVFVVYSAYVSSDSFFLLTYEGIY